MKTEAGSFLAKTIQWAWDCGLEITSTHRRMYAPGFPDNDKLFDPSGYNMDLAMRRREECWPVIRFTHPGTRRSQEFTARNWDEMERMIEYQHESIFAKLGCPVWPAKKKEATT